MTPQEQALRDAFLAEMWKPCRELSYGERVAKRRADRVQQREMEERQAINNASTPVEESSTGCAEIGGQQTDGNAA